MQKDLEDLAAKYAQIVTLSYIFCGGKSDIDPKKSYRKYEKIYSDIYIPNHW